MRIIHRDRRQDGIDFLVEVLIQVLGIFRLQLIQSAKIDIFFFERRHQFTAIQRVACIVVLAHPGDYGLELLGGREPRRIRLIVALFNQVLQRGDANHKELVEVRAEDAIKAEAFQQGIAGILRFFQDAAVELEPACLAIQIIDCPACAHSILSASLRMTFFPKTSVKKSLRLASASRPIVRSETF